MSLNLSNVKATIRTYICESFLADRDDTTLHDDDDLLMVLDSLQILRMLLELEGEYSITVDNNDLTPENLGTIEKLAAFVERKRQEAVC